MKSFSYLILILVIGSCTYFDENEIAPIKKLSKGITQITGFNSNYLRSEQGWRYGFITLGYNFPTQKDSISININDISCEVYYVAPTNKNIGNIDTIYAYAPFGVKNGKATLAIKGDNKKYHSPNEIKIAELDKLSELKQETGFLLSTDYYRGQNVKFSKDSILQIQIPVFHQGVKGSTSIKFTFYSGETQLFPDKVFSTKLTDWDQNSGYIRIFYGSTSELNALSFPKEFEIRAFLTNPTKDSEWYWSGGNNPLNNLSNTIRKNGTSNPEYSFGFKLYTF